MAVTPCRAVTFGGAGRTALGSQNRASSPLARRPPNRRLEHLLADRFLFATGDCCIWHGSHSSHCGPALCTSSEPFAPFEGHLILRVLAANVQGIP